MDFLSVRNRPDGTPSFWSFILSSVLPCSSWRYTPRRWGSLRVSSRHHNVYGEQAQLVLWNPQLFLLAAVGTLAVIALGSGFKTLELAQGGSSVATMLGGRLVAPTTTDPDERKLRNVVEEMAIAAGVPVPQVYLLPEEQGINAFAAGHSTSDAVVAVTAGAVRLLTRDELQGVIGHEFSHILNGDMRLNLRLMGIVFGILCLAVIGRVLLYTRSRSSKDKNPLPLLGLALIVIGWIGVFFGRLIQAAVSRQREFLADASSVQFTRNPAGLAARSRKIGGLSFGSKLEAAHAEEASHMFFGNGMSESFFHLMETHPPLAERIRAIDPSFDGTFPPVSVTEAYRRHRGLRRRRGRPCHSRSRECRVGKGPGRARAADHCRAHRDGRHRQSHARPSPLRRGFAGYHSGKPASRRPRRSGRQHAGLCAPVERRRNRAPQAARGVDLRHLRRSLPGDAPHPAGRATRRHARQAAAGGSRHPRAASLVADAIPAVPDCRAEAG